LLDAHKLRGDTTNARPSHRAGKKSANKITRTPPPPSATTTDAHTRERLSPDAIGLSDKLLLFETMRFDLLLLSDFIGYEYKLMALNFYLNR
jgi:hypothetical protein